MISPNCRWHWPNFSVFIGLGLQLIYIERCPPSWAFGPLTLESALSYPTASTSLRYLIQALLKDCLCRASLHLVTTNSGKMALAATLNCTLERIQRRHRNAPVFAPRQHKAPMAFDTLPPSSARSLTPKSLTKKYPCLAN